MRLSFIPRNIFNNHIPVLLLVLLFSLPMSGQSGNEPFSTLKFRLSGVSNSNRNIFHRYWSSNNGIKLDMSMPFYWGEIQGGGRIFGHDNKFDLMPDFISNFIFLGWGVDLITMKNFQWFNGIRTGLYVMHFDDEEINITQRTESELAVELFSRIEINFFSDFSAHFSAGYLRVYTYKRLEFFMLSAGIGLIIETPVWLRNLLK